MTARLRTRISGIPCEVDVYHEPEQPMRITGTGFGDCDPPEHEYFEVAAVYDRKGYPAPWLQAKLTSDDTNRIYEEFQQWLNNE